MPRANRRRRDERGLPPALFARESRERFHGAVWVVRRVTGRDGDRRYRCPGCQQMFDATLSHVVAWPASAGAQDRRHWHASCWRARHERSPRGDYG